MPELNRNFTKGRMNKDLDERMVPRGEYRDALNVEVSTSEGSNVGTIQTLKGNELLTNNLFSAKATCVGNISSERDNKLYWLVSDPEKNPDASVVYPQAEQDDANSIISISHDVFSDYIMEYDEVDGLKNYVAVEHYKVVTTISNDSHNTGDHLHISDLNHPNDIRYAGIQVGMEVYINNMITSVIKIEADPATDTGNWNGWRVYTEHTASDVGFGDLAVVTAGTTVTFKLPKPKRALGFSHFADQKPKKSITGINIIDDLLFWTDGITEPKKINIKRCIYGSQQLDPITHPNGTRALPTLLVVNGDSPSLANGRLGNVALYPSAITYPFLSHQYTTVIKKSPLDPLLLNMSNTTRPDQPPIDGLVIVNTEVVVPSGFFFTAEGDRLPTGEETIALTFNPGMDWAVGDTVEWFAEHDDAGFQDEPVAVLVVSEDVLNDNTQFKFEVASISEILIKPYVNFKVRLQQDDPLFEFKFPRFAYRWKYEDGEYSCYSPFSDVAFLPEEFDYLPKKGFNLGMTNNLRYLVLSGFKPKTMPLDVVAIDVLYKESNSPNVYTVDTIKAPSVAVKYLGTDAFSSDNANGWFGKIKYGSNFAEIPTTLNTTPQLVGVSALTGDFVHVVGGDFFTLEDRFSSINMKVGDVITLGSSGNIGTGTLKVSGMQNTTNQVPSFFGPVDVIVSQISISSTDASGIVTFLSAHPTWNTAGNTVTFNRNIAEKPAVFIGDPIGSLHVKTDMIHATVPSNQLLRPFDNVPTSALAQEITGNRIIYGNYVQNYNLTSNTSELTKVSFVTTLNSRSNVRQNVRYDDRTALIHPTNGSAITFSSSLNAIKPVASKPERSLKSLRDYQVGIVYMDEFGRQTPIQTNDDAVKRIPKSKAIDYSSLRIQLDSDHSTFPNWATHFKFYIKENANEYYNLAMDRFYSAEDGNVWISFPSSERNKIDEETFLILKKQHDNDVFVREKARYKILAIENEAPTFVKTKYNAFGIITPSFSSIGFPKIESSFMDINASSFSSNTSMSAAINAPGSEKERVVRLSKGSNKSRWYEVVSIVTSGSYKRVIVSKPFDIDVAFTTIDNTASGDYVNGVTVEIAYKEIKVLPEFSGRFFVKIHKDGTFLKNITARAPDRNFTAINSFRCARLKRWGTNTTVHDAKGQEFWAGHSLSYAANPPRNTGGVPGQHWFIDEVAGVGVHATEQDLAPFNFEDGRGYTPISPGQGNSADSRGSFDISYHDMHEPRGTAFNIGPWSVLRDNMVPPIASKDKALGKLFKSAGTLFRFKNDSTIYKITHCRRHAIENYDSNPGTDDLNFGGGYELTTNHREKFRIEFTPEIGATVDAVGQAGSNYDPFLQNKENDGGTAFWNNEWGKDYNTKNHKRTIEFVEEFAADDSYTSDNPAIWETEPKENIDIDLYNEASAALPIKNEFDAYRNEVYKTDRHIKPNALDYYNCFSFNNGVESNRIRDDFNTVTIDKGPKVSTVLAEQYKEEHRKSGLIYSGIYNSISGVNNLNQFIQAEKITKDINPSYGSIQKLHSRSTADGDLIALCEDRILKILADKDALFNADGNTNVTATNRVLGTAVPYSGENGISTDPESFAFDQYRCYFTDKSRGAVMRLSRDGLTPISDHGMRDYFKDVLRISNLSLVGSYDDNKKLYNLTMREGSDNLFKPVELVTATTGDGLDFIDFADANIIGFIPADIGGSPGVGGDGTGPFAFGTSVPYAHGVIGNPNTSFNVGNVSVQAFGQYDANNDPSAGGTGGGYGPNVTQFHLPIMDIFGTGITSRISAMITALRDCPNGDVFLHVQIQGGSQREHDSYQDTGFPIVTFKVNSIVSTGTRFEINVSYFSGLHGGNIDTYYFWFSTSGCETSGGGDPSLATSLNSSNLGFVEITASFSEDSRGWSSFKSWLQESGVSLNDDYFTFSGAELYQHHKNETRNNFYGIQYSSIVCAIFNDAPSSVKSFSALSYEGSQSRIVANTHPADGEYYNQVDINGWYADYISTDLETGFVPEFREKEGKWFNYIKGNQENTLSNLNVKQFSTQGIGSPSVVSASEAAPKVPFTLTIKDTGDTD